MITCRKAAARLHVQRGDTHVRMCVPAGGFGDLLQLEDELLPPETSLAAGTVRETLFYLCAGALTPAEPDLQTRVLVAGAFQSLDDTERVNASRTEWARVFRIRLREGAAPEPAPDRVWFSSAERRGRLRLVGSSDGRGGSLLIRPGVRIYSSLLDPGQHVVSVLGAGRCAWIHVVRGSVDVLGRVLEASDSAGIEGCLSFGVTARLGSEVLLFDLPAQPDGAADP